MWGWECEDTCLRHGDNLWRRGTQGDRDVMGIQVQGCREIKLGTQGPEKQTEPFLICIE